jgi:hypothetical protein
MSQQSPDMRQFFTGIAAGCGLAAAIAALALSMGTKAIRPAQPLPQGLPAAAPYAQHMGGSGYGRNWQPIAP